MKHSLGLLCLAALLFLAGIAWAQVSPRFDLSWHVVASGGREGMAAGSRQVHSTMGQFVVGPGQSSQYYLGAGYWYGAHRTRGPSSLTLTAVPDVLLANGVDAAVLTVTARDAAGSGAPFAGAPVTLTWNLGFDPSPVVVTLDAGGVATTTYVAGVVPGIDLLTAELASPSLVATATVLLNNTPLIGDLTSRYGALLTYTFVITNADPLQPQTNLVITGSVPLYCEFITATGATYVPNGGDYGWGYVVSPVFPSVAPGENRTITWVVRPIYMIGGRVETQAHAQSDTAVLRLRLTNRIYRVLLPYIFREAAWP